MATIKAWLSKARFNNVFDIAMKNDQYAGPGEVVKWLLSYLKVGIKRLGDVHISTGHSEVKQSRSSSRIFFPGLLLLLIFRCSAISIDKDDQSKCNPDKHFQL